LPVSQRGSISAPSKDVDMSRDATPIFGVVPIGHRAGQKY